LVESIFFAVYAREGGAFSSHCFSSQWECNRTVVFQYPNRYTILHVACTSTFYAHFHNNCIQTQGKYNLSYCKTNYNCRVWNHSVGFCTLWELGSQHIYNVTMKQTIVGFATLFSCACVGQIYCFSFINIFLKQTGWVVGIHYLLLD